MALKQSLLIIDDDKDLCYLLKQILGSLKHIEVVSAHTLQDGMDTLLHGEFNAVMLENFLPDGLGLTAISQIRELQPNCKIIMATAESYDATREQAIMRGAFYFIKKPLEYKQILQLADLISSPIYMNGNALKQSSS